MEYIYNIDGINGGTMTDYFIMKTALHLLSFIVSFYALSGIRLDKVFQVHEPLKAQILLILSSMGLGYTVAQFLLAL